MIAKIKEKKRFRLPVFKMPNILPLFFSSVFLILGIWLFIANVQLMRRQRELSSSINETNRQIKNFEAQNEELKTGIDSATQETFLEKLARETFQLKKPGEKVVAVVAPQPNGQSASAESKKNWWQRFLEKLGL